MEYFSEIYGTCYQAVAAVLARAAESPVSRQDISAIAARHTSTENTLYTVSRLTSGEWPLLKKDDSGLYSPIIHNLPAMPLTKLQRAWLSAMLEDRRCSAFLDEPERAAIREALDHPPLYSCDDVESVGVCCDGDRFSDPEYAGRLRDILDAIRNRSILYITYTGSKGNRIHGDFLPCRLEYSSKDDKLRLYALLIRYGRSKHLVTINLGRIDSVRPSRERYDGEADIDRLRLQSRKPEPAIVELVDTRNALERFMLQFASYEKRTRYIEEENKYICSLYYDSGDEMELLIRLLSFGPVIRLLSPADLVDMMRNRVRDQWNLLTGVEMTGEEADCKET